MRSKALWLAPALLAALVVVGVAVAQSSDQKGGATGGSRDRGGRGDAFQGGRGGRGGDRGGPGGAFQGRGGRGGDRGGRGLSAEAIVERLLTFDRNKDGKVTKDELPERMQDLIAKGDTTKDGALDKDELTKLATTLGRDGLPFGFGGFGGRGFGGPGFGGRGGPGGGFGPGDGIQAALDDLKLSDQKKETAEAAVRAHQENVRRLLDLARADLLLKMTEVLSEEEFKTFKEAVDRQPGFTDRPGGRGGRPPSPAPPAGAFRPGDLEKRLDQLQKDLDSLRREIRR
jgi:hypothetical protein